MERGLLNVKKMQAADRKRTKEEREIHARFAVFARFHSQAEHDAIVEVRHGVTVTGRVRVSREKGSRQCTEQVKEWESQHISATSPSWTLLVERGCTPPARVATTGGTSPAVSLTDSSIPSSSRQIVGPVLLATANSDSSWNPAEALRALEKTHPKKVAMAADECACADNRQLISSAPA